MDAKLLAAGFRECAAAFRTSANETGQARIVIMYQSAQDSGSLLRSAWNAGFLKEFDGLSELIENWKSVFPTNFIECDANLWFQFVGNSIRFDSSTNAIGETIPGIVSQIAPSLFPASSLLAFSSNADSLAKAAINEAFESQKLRRAAVACELLADLVGVEWGPPRDKQDIRGRLSIGETTFKKMLRSGELKHKVVTAKRICLLKDVDEQLFESE